MTASDQQRLPLQVTGCTKCSHGGVDMVWRPGCCLCRNVVVDELHAPHTSLGSEGFATDPLVLLAMHVPSGAGEVGFGQIKQVGSCFDVGQFC
jgi:hypothetical protein